MTVKEELKKLDSLNEEIDSTTNVIPIEMNIIDGRFRGAMPAQNITLIIPEGVEIIDGSLNWTLFSSAPNTGGTYFTTIKRVVFPTSLRYINNRYFFGIQPQYKIELEFKGDVVDLIYNMAKEDGDGDIINFKKFSGEKREEKIKRYLCAILNIPYTRAIFIFDVPLDLDAFDTAAMGIDELN